MLRPDSTPNDPHVLAQSRGPAAPQHAPQRRPLPPLPRAHAGTRQQPGAGQLPAHLRGPPPRASGAGAGDAALRAGRRSSPDPCAPRSAAPPLHPRTSRLAARTIGAGAAAQAWPAHSGCPCGAPRAREWPYARVGDRRARRCPAGGAGARAARAASGEAARRAAHSKHPSIPGAYPARGTAPLQSCPRVSVCRHPNVRCCARRNAPRRMMAAATSILQTCTRLYKLSRSPPRGRTAPLSAAGAPPLCVERSITQNARAIGRNGSRMAR